MATATDFEKLGVFYLGRPLRSGRARTPSPSSLLYDVQGSDDARRVRRHDRQRQDRPVHRPARGGGASTASPRSSSIPRATSAICCSRSRDSRPEDFLPWINEDDARGRGSSPTDFARAAGGAVDEGPRRVGPGRRAHPAAARRGGLRDLHAGQQRGHAAVDPRVASPRRPRADARRRRALPRARRGARRPACSACSASTPIRCRAASTSCSRRILDAAWRAGRDLDLAALIRQIQTPPVHARRRDRPRVVLPGEGPLRAGDAAQQSARRRRASRRGSRASRSTSASCSTPPRASRASRSSRSPTSATPSACSSSRCC